jgi:two-component system sensor histidine kinase VicK
MLSFRSKTILGIALIESILLVILVFSALNFMSDSNEELLKQRANVTLRLFKSAIKDAVLSTDLATLESFVEEIMSNSDVVYARITSNGVILAEGGSALVLQKPREVDSSLSQVIDGVYDIRAEIVVAGITYGVIEMGLSTASIESMLAKAKRWIATIASLEVSLVALFSFVLGTYLTRQLLALKNASNIIALSGPGHQIPISGNDELSEVAHAFNSMSKNLEKSYGELNNSQAEMEHKITERTRELNTILILSPDGFVLSNTDNNVVYINPAFLTMTGLKADTLIGKNTHIFNELMVSLFDSKKMNNMEFINKGDTQQLIYLSRPASRILHVNIKTLLGLKGKTEGYVFYFRDVSHEKEVDRMKSEFLSTAAHELRTPLASIYGFSELLKHREYDKKVSHDIIETIHRQSGNLKKLLDELLDLSRIEARAGKDFNMANNSLEEIVKQSCTETEGAFTDHKVDVQTLEYWPTLTFDDDKMRQVFINLLSNACKYSPEHKCVILTTSERKKNGYRQFGVSITDKGIGMTPQQFSHLGVRFYRADNSGATPGSGLGVSLVKEIVSIHAGEVEFVTAQGKGMVVTVWLPIVKS